jgi:exodeoxyribonuclease-3
VNVYAPHGTRLGTEKFTYKLEWIKRLRNYFDKSFKKKEKVVLCGDLMSRRTSLMFGRSRSLGTNFISQKLSGDAIQDLKKWGFVDLFRQINDDAMEFTWWDHFLHSVEMDKGMRLDHIWASPAARGDLYRLLDRQETLNPGTRKRSRPVIAEFAI